MSMAWRSLLRSPLLKPYRAFTTMRAPDVEVDNLIVGAGVVGLALGEKLTRDRTSETTIVIDKNKRYGEETRYIFSLYIL